MAVTDFHEFDTADIGGSGSTWAAEGSDIPSDLAADDESHAFSTISASNSSQNLTMTGWQGSLPDRIVQSQTVYPLVWLRQQASSTLVQDQTFRFRQGGAFAGDDLAPGNSLTVGEDDEFVGSTGFDAASAGLTPPDIDSTFGFRVKYQNTDGILPRTVFLDLMVCQFGFIDRLEPLKHATKGYHRGMSRGMR